MTFSGLARFSVGTALAGLLFVAPIEISAQPGNPTQDFSGFTAAGSYLAARHAGLERDAIAAAGFYRDALRRDPKNGELLDRAFLSLLVGGDVDGAVKFAERVLQVDKSDRVARLVLGHRVRVLPVATVGTEFVKGWFGIPYMRRPGIRIGPPLDFSAYYDQATDRGVLRWVTDEIMAAVQQLSGQTYVDVYATSIKSGALAGRNIEEKVRPRPGAGGSAPEPRGGVPKEAGDG